MEIDKLNETEEMIIADKLLDMMPFDLKKAIINSIFEPALIYRFTENSVWPEVIDIDEFIKSKQIPIELKEKILINNNINKI